MAEADYPFSPDLIESLGSLAEAPQNSGDQYARHLFGRFHAPLDGEYTFWISSDGPAELWMTLDGVRTRIAEVPGKTGERTWDKYSAQASASILLSQGQAYTLEAIHTEETGSDHLAVGGHFPDNRYERPLRARRFLTPPQEVSFVQDTDGDGLTDYEEWVVETDPSLADTSGDGIVDFDAVALNLDPLAQNPEPLLAAAWVLQYDLMSDMEGYELEDLDEDGLTNLDEYLNGTHPRQWDSNENGVADYDEIHYFHYDPQEAEIDFTPVHISSTNGDATVATHGAWTKDGQAIYATDNVGALEYTLTLPEAGLYRLGVGISEQSPYVSAEDSVFDLRASVNGISQGVRSANAPYGQTTWVYYYLPYLPSGTHDLRLDWVNTRLGTGLRVNGLKLEQFGGPDSDQNGWTDWIEHRVEQALQTDELPAESLVSPFNLEGNAYVPEAVTAEFYPLSSPELTEPLTVVPGLARRYYTNVPLDPQESTRVVIDPENGLNLIEHEVEWARFNLFDHPEFHLRRDDALLLTAFVPGETPVAFDLEIIDPQGLSETYALSAGEALETLFDQTGTWTVRTELPVAGEPETLLLETDVTVHHAGFSPTPFVVLGHTRTWQPLLTGPEIELEQDGNVSVVEPNPASSPRSFRLSALGEGGGVIARLPDEGDILASTQVDVVINHQHEQTSHQVVETFDDGSVMVQAYLRLSHIPDDLSVTIHVFKSGVTLEDGTVTRHLTAEDFDEFGRYRFFMIRSPGVTGGTCHRISITQDGEVF